MQVRNVLGDSLGCPQSRLLNVSGLGNTLQTSRTSPTPFQTKFHGFGCSILDTTHNGPMQVGNVLGGSLGCPQSRLLNVSGLGNTLQLQEPHPRPSRPNFMGFGVPPFKRHTTVQSKLEMCLVAQLDALRVGCSMFEGFRRAPNFKNLTHALPDQTSWVLVFHPCKDTQWSNASQKCAWWLTWMPSEQAAQCLRAFDGLQTSRTLPTPFQTKFHGFWCSILAKTHNGLIQVRNVLGGSVGCPQSGLLIV